VCECDCEAKLVCREKIDKEKGIEEIAHDRKETHMDIAPQTQYER
jgi:hypothetical protein